MTKTFRDLGVAPELCDALTDNGIDNPFPIQELTLPLALDGHDLIGQARTGTGKTLAFGLPLLQRLDPDTKATQALVIVPTRELCLQVHTDLRIGSALGLTTTTVYGGVGYDEQIEALTGGVHVVVGTPGRLLDQLNRGNLDLSNVTQLVLDEADEMLDMGFLPDVERLIEACPSEGRHTMLFSATMPTPIVKLARRYMHHPTFTRADHEPIQTVPEVTQYFLQVHRMDKPRLLARILQSRDRGGVFAFVRTKHMADRLVRELEELNTPAVAVHGDLRQETRERNLERFRSGKATVLVCTEVAARGLDVSGVSHVVNYDCPDDDKMYLHRIGRTARAGEAGVAITFAEFNEVDRLNVIRKAVGASDNPIEQVFSTSPQLDEWFDLPPERPWDHLSDSSSSRSSTSKRQGHSDGRPKSGRSREGRGGGHDAGRRSGKPDTGSGRKDSAKRTSRDTDRDTDHGPRTGDEATTTPRTRTRTRARTNRTASSGAGDADQRAQGGDRASDSTDRSRQTDTQPEQGGDAAASDGGNERAGDERPRSSRDRGRGGQTRVGQSRGSRGSGGRGKSGGGKNSGKASSGDHRKGSGGRDRHGESTPASTQVRARGEDARGEGQPQLARRVKVEHLP